MGVGTSGLSSLQVLGPFPDVGFSDCFTVWNKVGRQSLQGCERVDWRCLENSWICDLTQGQMEHKVEGGLMCGNEGVCSGRVCCGREGL